MSKQKSKPGTVRMKFSADQYYGVSKNGDVTASLKNPLYVKDVEYDIEEKDVARWLKRGGVIVAEEATDGRAVVATKAEDKPQEPVDGSKGKEEDGGKSATAKTQDVKTTVGKKQ